MFTLIDQYSSGNSIKLTISKYENYLVHFIYSYILVAPLLIPKLSKCLYFSHTKSKYM